MGLRNMDALGLQGITGRFIGADKAYVIKLEEQAGFRLPDSYSEFITKYGASLFADVVGFRSEAPSPWAVDGVEAFDVFYGMSERPHLDILRVNIRLHDVIPHGLIAIAHDPGSNLILLDDSGEIYFVDRETGERFLCARDFGSFLNSFEARRVR
jgi:hypothetical protein